MLRAALAEDAGRIAQLHIKSWRRTYGRELSAAFLDAQDADVWAMMWQSHLQEGVRVLLAEEGADLVGFVACGPARCKGAGREAWEIYNLHVNGDRHRCGIGSELFTGASDLGRAQGAGELVLWVVETNSGARSFYEIKGMVCDGSRQERPLGDGQRLHEVHYRMRISGDRS